jgi:hypothetical protein
MAGGKFGLGNQLIEVAGWKNADRRAPPNAHSPIFESFFEWCADQDLIDLNPQPSPIFKAAGTDGVRTSASLIGVTVGRAASMPSESILRHFVRRGS